MTTAEKHRSGWISRAAANRLCEKEPEPSPGRNQRKGSSMRDIKPSQGDVSHEEGCRGEVVHASTTKGTHATAGSRQSGHERANCPQVRTGGQTAVSVEMPAHLAHQTEPV